MPSSAQTVIAGHELTPAETKVLDTVIAYLREHSGDSGWTRTTSPRGDGKLISVQKIFPKRTPQDRARRAIVAKLFRLGVLRACEIAYVCGSLGGLPIIGSTRGEA